MTGARKPTGEGPLAGIDILDLTAVLLGPMATGILADYGANVVKIEPLDGDMMRANGVSRHPDMGSIFLSVNRNKRSVALDLKSEGGREVLRRMLPSFDALVHNMRPAAMRRLGLDYDSVRALHPRIIYCEATGFGRAGLYADRPVLDDIIQAGSGICAIAKTSDGDAPDFVSTLLADKTAALALVNATLAALLARERTGEGQYVEVPMFETMTAFNLVEHMGGMTFEPQTQPPGYHRLLNGGRQPVKTKDGHMVILPYTEAHWRAFFGSTGQMELVQRYGIGNRETRNANVVKIYAELRKITETRTTAEWMEICEAHDVPASPIYALDALPDHPHARSVDLFQTMEHETEGTIRYVRPTMRFSATPAPAVRGAPVLGRDSRDVLEELGFGAAEIAALRESGVLGGAG